MATAQELIAAGDPQAALAVLQQEVRSHASDARQRIFLFQLLIVLGEWDRALTQLHVCGELDAGALAMVAAYREAVQSEAVRDSIFRGQGQPQVLGDPQVWVAWLVEALQADGRGDPAAAAALRSRALEAAPAVPGRLNGEAFEWISDADSRLGPVLEAVIDGRYWWVPFSSLSKLTIEAPVDLRDLVWAGARLEFSNGSTSGALLPVRYPGSAQASAALQLSRLTEWVEMAPEQFRGLGQRTLATSAVELGLLEARDIVLMPGAAGGQGERAA